eukprot:TRINITY_DN1038_c0_g1_i1.p1 TRINITY_DN1038_c0_g1~~TRINITY_DN1038_c0_g1_i1.p1  ORF type:complete len:685 (-),score=89.39 TRINITY_DN1038_c0_g1_i1:256-2310(-)
MAFFSYAVLVTLVRGSRYIATEQLAQESQCFHDLPQDCCNLFKAMETVCATNSSGKHLPWKNCKDAVTSMWFDEEDFNKSQKNWIFETFTSHPKRVSKRNRTKDQALTPVFWTGFAHKYGTRDVMDEIVKALPGCGNESNFKCADVEHKASKLGKIMRDGKWYRQCHVSHKDRLLWIKISKAFSFRRQRIMNGLAKVDAKLSEISKEDEDLAMGLDVLDDVYDEIESSKVVHILVNYRQEKLNDTFLFKHELPLLERAASHAVIKLWSFKATCKEVDALIPAKLQDQTECTSLTEPSAHQDSKLMHFKLQIDCLEQDSKDCCGSKNKACLVDACKRGLLDTVAYQLQTFPDLISGRAAKRATVLDNLPTFLGILVGFNSVVANAAFNAASDAVANAAADADYFQGKEQNMRTILMDLKRLEEAGQTPLHIAAKYGQLKVVEYLVHGFPNLVGRATVLGLTPLYAATATGQLKVVKFLLDRFPELIKNKATHNQTALHAAAATGQLRVVEYLVHKFPGLIKNKTSHGQTALHAAATTGQLRVVEYLVHRYPELIKNKTRHGQTALHAAAATDQLEVVKYLVQEFPDLIKKKTRHGHTALHIAARWGSLGVVKYLGHAFPDLVRLKDEHGRTALHTAAQRNQVEVVRYLVEAFPKLSKMRDKTGILGRQPIVYAATDEIREILRGV